MKRQFFGGAYGRTVASCGLTIAALLLIPAVCRAQTPPKKQTPNQSATAEDQPMASGPAMDLLAEKLAAEITKRAMAGAVVVGFSGPNRRISELGVNFRGVVSDALAKQSASAKIPDGAAIRAFLSENRIAEDMLYSNALGGWIAARMHADGYVTARLSINVRAQPALIAELFACVAGACVDSVTIYTPLTLTDQEFEDGAKEFVPTLKINVGEVGVDTATAAKCVTCPKPEAPLELRRDSFEGTSHLLATVMPDGTAEDIFVVAPAGHNLDGLAADAVLAWKFTPALDAKGHPVPTQMPIDIPFKFEAVAVKPGDAGKQ